MGSGKGRAENGWFKAELITSAQKPREGEVHRFFKILELSKPLRRACLYVTALGIYEGCINGSSIGAPFFAPGFTNYKKRLQYHVFEVAAMLAPGQNELSFLVADGWYKGRFTFQNKTNLYGKRLALAARLELVFEDGSEQVVTTGPDWLENVSTPWRYAGFYDGEDYDAALEGFPGEPLPVKVFRGKIPPRLDLAPDCGVRLQYSLPPPLVVSSDSGRTILDFGQNFAGIIELDPAGLTNETLTIRHGELLDSGGNLYTANLRKAKAEIVYRAAGSGKVYRPRFTYMGFRYVELTGAPYREGMLSAHAVYSDMPRIGNFSCSDENINRLYDNIIRSQQSNFVDIPTDCPQRDERQGYTGDAQVFAEAASLNYDTGVFFGKYLTDLRLGQAKSGLVDMTVPYEYAIPILRVTSAGWGDAAVIIPWTLYEQYGDLELLRESYDSMKRWCDYSLKGAEKSSRADLRRYGAETERFIWDRGFMHLGDWLAPNLDRDAAMAKKAYISTCFLAHSCDMVSRTASILGKNDDAEKYALLFDSVSKAWCTRFLKKDGGIEDGFQAAYVMALAYGLIPPEKRQAAADKLAEQIRADGGLTTGFISTGLLLPVLCDHGYEQLAFDLLLGEDCPSWLYQLRRGATSIWERWDAVREDGSVNETLQGKDNMVSFNHYAFGAVGAFFYRYILGINPAEPGYTKIRISPCAGSRLDWARGSLETRQGRVSVAWRREGGKTAFEIEIPGGVCCDFQFRGTESALEPGTHSFII